MSFAMEVKEEILNHTFTEEQKIMLLSGFIKYNGELIYTNNGAALKLTSNSNNVIRNIFSILKTIYEGNIEISIIQIQKLRRNKIYQLMLTENVIEFLTKHHIYDSLTSNKIIEMNLERYDKKLKQELTRAYTSGIFIAVGSVNSPETTNYHLELQFKEENSAIYISKILKKHSFDFKTITKRNKTICYIKKSIAVSDFLKFMDASISVMKFENTRINRDVSNNINRMINIDIYNQQKSSETGSKQIQEIELIQKNNLISELSPKAQVLSQIRLENPDASFSELEYLMNEKNIAITKSGISNLFKIISKLANTIGD
ncbi:DNA-binding protein WhiA [Spiroplasma sp. BIUS-1]|uniref:DNA-binding protein WhiA n=1 Tax=Spiroplasma sp. BIUS-1 TaxID=216964 RepID=UPI00139753BB|nr:DNA-binding protein WhiA [Spiroplasma sp. BIUS-1]QHX36321.1 DNA-binding protein WhiA [Spiroplasma sp. BIUS-1]